MDENKRIVICRRCKKPEYWGEMRWLSGFCVCRDCYKAQWESENHKPYTWDDLDGKRPTMEEFEMVNEYWHEKSYRLSKDGTRAAATVGMNIVSREIW